MLISASLIFVILLALVFEFINGMRDLSNIVSTTQVVSSAIIGVGASERFGKARWGVAGDILTALVITIPISALFSAGIYSLLVAFNVSL